MKPYTTLCVVSMVTSSSILKNIPCMTNVSKMQIHQCSLSVLVIKVGVDVILGGYVGKHYTLLLYTYNYYKYIIGHCSS